MLIWFLPILKGRFGQATGALFYMYLFGTASGTQDISNQQRIVNDFATDSATEARQEVLVNYLLENQSIYRHLLRSSAWHSFAAEKLIPTDLLNFKTDYTESGLFLFAVGDIPALIAGGVYEGTDARSVTGSVFIRPTQNVLGVTTGIEVRTAFNFYVKDVIDFCPFEHNNPGGRLAQIATVRLSRLEEQEIARPVTFELRFAPESITRRS